MLINNSYSKISYLGNTSIKPEIRVNESKTIQIEGLDSETLNKLNNEISIQKSENGLTVTSINKKSNINLLKKILKSTELPDDGQGIKLNPDQQRVLGLYFESIPSIHPNMESYLVNLNSNYTYVSVVSTGNKKLIFPVPLTDKNNFGKDPRILGQNYRYGNLTETKKVEQLEGFTKKGRSKLGKAIPVVNNKQLQFQIPQVKDRPLKIVFLSLYPDYQDYVFQSIGPNYIESYLKKNLPENSVKISHFETALEDPSSIKAKIKEMAPDIIGISAKTNSHEQLEYWMQYLKKECPDKLKIIGGQLANASHKEILEDYPESLLILDNGEVPFKRIADIALSNDKPENLGKIPNLSFNLDGKPILTAFEDFNWITTAHARPSDTNIKEVLDKNGVVAIRLSQGCWGKCTFCTHPGKWHEAKIDDIIAVLKDWKEKFGLKGIFFTDDEIVNKDKKEAYVRIEELSDKLIAANLGITWTTALRADCVNWIDEKLINKMKKAGCVSVFLGIESGSDSQLVRYGKPVANVPITAEINEKAIKLFADHGMKVGIGWIQFDPLMPTLRELKENINFIERNNLLDQNIRLDASLRVHRGSKYAKQIGQLDMKLLGELQPNMFHYDATYLDPRVGTIKDHVKEWIKDTEEIDNKIHSAKFQSAVDSSQQERFQPILDLGKKLQTLTVDYIKALVNVFPETQDDKVLDGIVSQNETTRNIAKNRMNDKEFMRKRNQALKVIVTNKREELFELTQKFAQKRSKLLEEYSL